VTGSPSVLVVAKAPVPGRVKTRLASAVGPEASAELAAAALLDTLAVCRTAFGPGRCRLALEGSLDGAVRGAELRSALAGWRIIPQRGPDLATRLAHAHHDAGGPGGVVQIGMDTPQVTADLLHEVVAGLATTDAVLGPAEDGGWWVLALRDPAAAQALVGVPMSTERTGALTAAALRDLGLAVRSAPTLRDVDTVADAEAVAAVVPGSRFAAAWSRTAALR